MMMTITKPLMNCCIILLLGCCYPLAACLNDSGTVTYEQQFEYQYETTPTEMSSEREIPYNGIIWGIITPSALSLFGLMIFMRNNRLLQARLRLDQQTA